MSRSRCRLAQASHCSTTQSSQSLMISPCDLELRQGLDEDQWKKQEFYEHYGPECGPCFWIEASQRKAEQHPCWERREALDGRQWTQLDFYEHYGLEYGPYFWNEAGQRVAEQHAVFHACSHDTQQYRLASERLQIFSVDIVKQQYIQTCKETFRLLYKLKRDIDDASVEDYHIWQAHEIEQKHRAEIAPTEAVGYIQAATLEHASSNSWGSTVALPLHVAVGALLHHAIAKAGIQKLDERTERHVSRISKQTQEAAKAFITAVINIRNLQFIKEALVQCERTCSDDTRRWINATNNKLYLAMQRAQSRLPSEWQ